MTAIANNRAENLGVNLPANVCSTRSLVISALALVVIGLLVVSCLSLFKYHFLPPVAARRMAMISAGIITVFSSAYARIKCSEAIFGREEQHQVDIVRPFTQAEVQEMLAEIYAHYGIESVPSKPVTFEPKPSQAYSCSICIENESSNPAYSHVAAADVVHRFCKECFEGWMNSQPTDPLPCPVCRVPLIRPTIQN